MKHSRRMVVISEEEYKRLKTRSLLNDQKRKVALTKKNSKQIRKQILDKQRFVSGKTALQLFPASVESFFLPQYQSQVSAVLSELQLRGAKLNDNRELVMPYGDTIHGSNIINLMKELLTGTRQGELPVGWREFMTLVANTNIPLAAFKKKSSKDTLNRLRNDQVDWEEF